MIFKNHETYENLKFIALLIVPLGTLISTILGVWGLPYGEQIMATFAAVDVFLGALVVASQKAYYKAQEGKDAKSD